MLALVLTISSIISQLAAQPELAVCNACNDSTDCRQSRAEECVSLGGVDRCYWKNDSFIYDQFGVPRICTGQSYECISLDYTTEYDESEQRVYSQCLRCCPNEELGEDVCRETLSTGQENCGTVDENIFGGFFTSIAPCCPGEVCLDNVAGVCGVFEESACESCVIWSYMVGDGAEYVTGDSCGDGLTCLDDGSADIPFSDNSYYGGGRRRLVPLSSEETIIFNGGVCVPETGVGEDGCSVDVDCADCMRCCDGTCIVNSQGEDCSFDGRGPCCYGDMCRNNECVAATSESDDDDSDDGHSKKSKYDSSDEIFAAAVGGLNNENEEENTNGNDAKYVVNIGRETSINLFVMLIIIVILLASVSVYCWYAHKNKTKMQSFAQTQSMDQTPDI